MAKFFIDRPVFAAVVSIVITLVGIVCMLTLPVAQFPQIVPPTVTIEATYPGATAETVAQALAAPIEQELSGAKGLLYYQSQCGNDGRMTMSVTFENGTDLDLNAVEVQNRVKKAEARLPEEVKRQGVSITKKATDILLLVNLKSDDPRYDDLFLSNYATINLVDALKRVPGAGDVSVYGAGAYAMRIWLRPDQMAQKQVTVSDLSQAVREQNGLYAAGRIGAKPNPEAVSLTLPVVAPGQLDDVEQFNDIILRANPDGSMLTVRDVGRAELGAQTYDQFARLNGKPTTLISIYLQPGANALATAKLVREEMAKLVTSFPAGVGYEIPYDTTRFVEVSIGEVKKTFLEAAILVILVTFLFLQSLRATLIPLLAIPISIIGTFAGMQALGFSINSLTLFGLVLSIGIVVDDAILVVENVERILSTGKYSVREATIKAMEEITGPIIASVLVLAAVFLPVAFLGGLTGIIYRQFAVTVAVSVAISGIVALTFSPALCCLLLKPRVDHQRKGFFGLFNRLLDQATVGYGAVVRNSIRFGIVTVLLFAGICFASWQLFRSTPGGFIPDEDQGYLMTAVVMPDGASLDRTAQMCNQVEEYFRECPDVENVVVMGGLNILASANSPDAALVYVTLKPWAKRTRDDQHSLAIVAKANRDLSKLQDGIAFVFNPPAVTGLGQRAGFEFQLQNRGGGDVRDLSRVTSAFLAKLRQRPEVVGAAVPLSVSLPQLAVDINRTRVKALGVPISDVFSTLQSFWGSLYVNDFTKFGRVWRVQLQAEPSYRSRPQDLSKIFVRNDKNEMLALSGLVDSRFQTGPNVVSRFNGYTSVQMTGAPAPGYSTGQAMTALTEVAKEELPEGFGYEWSGASLQEIKAGNQAPMIMGFGLVLVFLVLAAQYEKWALPLAVMLAVPLGLIGALVAVKLSNLSNDIYFQIGLLTLVGLSTKTAILIVEFCAAQHAEGKELKQAAIDAAKLRFRPILMTALSFILGVIPLVVSSGAGAGGRVSIGTGVLGGMLSATIFILLLVPLFFVLVQTVAEKLNRADPESQVPELNSIQPPV